MMKLVKWIFLMGVGIACVAVNVSAQPVESPGGDAIVKPVVGNVYVIERDKGNNICLSIGDDGILVMKNRKVSLSEEEKKAIKNIKDAPLQLMDESRKSPFQFNGEEVKMINFSHETFNRYSVVYFTRSKVVYMGHHFFAGMFPKIDVGRGADVEKYTDTISAVVEEIPEEAKIIPGYGPLSTKEDLENYKRMLIETTAIVRLKIKDGKDKKTIQGEGLGEQWSMWGTGLVSTDEWLGTIYESLMRE